MLRSREFFLLKLRQVSDLNHYSSYKSYGHLKAHVSREIKGVVMCTLYTISWYVPGTGESKEWPTLSTSPIGWFYWVSSEDAKGASVPTLPKRKYSVQRHTNKYLNSERSSHRVIQSNLRRIGLSLVEEAAQRVNDSPLSSLFPLCCHYLLLVRL